MRIEELRIHDRDPGWVLMTGRGGTDGKPTSLIFPEGTTVLFGANSAGKTTVLEAIDALLSGRSNFTGPRRPVPGKSSLVYWMSLVVALDKEVLLRNRWLTEAANYEKAPLGLIDNDKVVEVLVGQGADDAAARRLLAQELVEAARWVLTEGDHSLVVDAKYLSSEALAAARTVAGRDDLKRYDATYLDGHGDLLGTIARQLADTGHAQLRVPWWGNLVGQLRESGFRLVNIPVAPVDVHQMAHDAVLAAYGLATESTSRFFDFEYDPLDDLNVVARDRPVVSNEWLALNTPKTEDPFSLFVQKPAQDPWLVNPRPQVEDDDDLGDVRALVVDPRLVEVVPVDDNAKTFVVNPLLVKLAAMVGRRTAALCPSFVHEFGRPDVIVTDPRSWAEFPQRVEVVLMRDLDDGTAVPRSIDSFGAGTRRWVQAALALVAASLPAGFSPTEADLGSWEENDRRGMEWVPTDAREWEGRYGDMGPVDRRVLDLEERFTLSNSLVLIDEPEAHLHPAASASVSEWLRRLSSEVAGAVVATHSKEVLGLDSALVTRVLVRSGPQFVPMTGALATELAADAERLGITQADLLLLRRGVLFVEGPHDVAVLDEWLGSVLGAAGVRVIPAHGTENLKGLMESEVIAELGLRMGVLTDNTVVQRIRAGRPQSNEENVLHRIVSEAQRAGRHVQPFGLSKHDIAQYLPDDICAAIAPRFPGWQAALAACRVRYGTAKELKSFVRAEYGLRLDRGSVSRLARDVAQAGRIPQEILNLGREVEAWATGSRFP